MARNVLYASLAWILMLMLASPAQGANFTVTNTNDTGAGSLRQAIIDSNASAGVDQILFAIAGSGTKVIRPLSALPVITDTLLLDGYSQAGSVANTQSQGSNAQLRIELTGTGAPLGTSGLRINASGRVQIQGLAIGGFRRSGSVGGHGIESQSTTNVYGCWIGLRADGTLAANQGSGLEVRGSYSIGSSALADRNIISGNQLRGINAIGAIAGSVENNIIGLGNTSAARPNLSDGVLASNRVQLRNNVISSNGGFGVVLSEGSDLSTLFGNRIGTDASGIQAFGNAKDGIRISAFENGLNGVTLGSRANPNTIAFNEGGGIVIDGTPAPEAVFMAYNRIYENAVFIPRPEPGLLAPQPEAGLSPGLGIDLFPYGVNANDAGDADTGANTRQNFPVLRLANRDNLSGDFSVAGSLESTPNTSFRLVFYGSRNPDPSGFGEGEYLADGEVDVTTNSAGSVGFSGVVLRFDSAVAAGITRITATATRLQNGVPLDTSEFSPAQLVRVVGPNLFTVTKTADSNDGVCDTDCSLREAITVANATSNLNDLPDVIGFAIPGTGPHTLAPQSALPALSSAMTIDGYRQAGASTNSEIAGRSNAVLKIVLDGNSLPAATDLLNVTGADVMIRGLAIGRSPRDGLNVSPNAANFRFVGNFIGFNAAGGNFGNGRNGLFGNAPNMQIGSTTAADRNVFGGSATAASCSLSGSATVRNNLFGLNLAGNAVFGSNEGLSLGGTAGQSFVVRDNYFAGNTRGVAFFGANVQLQLQGNFFGFGADAGTPLANQTDAFLQAQTTASNVIGNVFRFASNKSINVLAGSGIYLHNNTFFNLNPHSALAIDLGNNGVSPNDPDDVDTGPNGLQNYPVLVSAQRNGSSLSVSGHLNSLPNSNFEITLCGVRNPNTASVGPCELPLPPFLLATNASGDASFNQSFQTNALPGFTAMSHISGLASRLVSSGVLESSEFAENVAITELTATTTTITADSPDPSGVGQAVTVQVSVTAASGSPTGTVNVSDQNGQSCVINALVQGAGSCVLTPALPGSQLITANYLGGGNFAPSSDDEPHVVNAPAASTSTTITSHTPSPSLAGASVMVSVNVQASSGSVSAPVTISDDTGNQCTAQVNAGVGSCSLLLSQQGERVITAEFAGNSSFLGSQASVSHIVNAIASSISITQDSPDPSALGQQVTVVVEVRSNNGVPSGTAVVSDGQGSSCNATLSANGNGFCLLTPLVGGTRSWSANYSGDGQFAASATNTLHNVSAIASQTQITAHGPQPSIPGQSVLVEVLVSAAAGVPSGSVQISDGNSTCSAALNSAGAGSCALVLSQVGLRTLTASYPSNASFLASSGQSQHLVSDTLLRNGFE